MNYLIAMGITAVIFIAVFRSDWLKPIADILDDIL